jgi:hypothetical protein
VKKVFQALFFSILVATSAPAVLIERTAETAAAAKNAAVGDARRKEFADALAGRIGAAESEKLASEISSAELAGLAGSVSIESEKFSATGYSADISVQFDKAALDKWLQERGFVLDSPAFAAGRAQVFLEVGGLGGFAEVLRASRETGAELRISGISSGRISATVRAEAYSSFVAHARVAGIQVSGQGDWL